MKSILDVSSIIYGGHNASPDRRVKGFPIGGIRKLFGIINGGLNISDFVLCFDGGQIIKKELLPTYKAGRIPDYSVLAQIDLVKELLLACDIPYHQDKKYEADDFIFSICKELDLLGDTEEVEIYTDDRDLSCCVTDKVTIRNVTSNGICIDRDNYSRRVVRGKWVPYNTILLWKVFHGDTSDNYRALSIPGLTYDVFSQRFLSEVKPLIKPDGLAPTAYAEYAVFEAICSLFSDILSKEDMKRLKEQGRIAYPYQIPVSDISLQEYGERLNDGELLYNLERKHMKIFGSGTFNMKKFKTYCSLLGLNTLKSGKFVDRDSAEAQEFYELLDLRARELSDGTLVGERYGNRRIIKPHGETLMNMDLPL